MLAKEAKYEHGLKKSDYDYDEVMNTIRDNNNASRGDTRHGKTCLMSFKQRKRELIGFVGIRGSWARRLSRLSDGLDAHVEVASRKRNSTVSTTVWEVT